MTDPESGIASSSDCNTVNLTADNAGAALTCTATNGAGLSSSVSVTIKIDKTTPVISGMPAVRCKVRGAISDGRPYRDNYSNALRLLRRGRDNDAKRMCSPTG